MSLETRASVALVTTTFKITSKGFFTGVCALVGFQSTFSGVMMITAINIAGKWRFTRVGANVIGEFAEIGECLATSRPVTRMPLG
jgi:hypothetical protein